MTKTETNLRATEEFVRQVLARNFKQNVNEDALRTAAEKLCAAIPVRECKAA